MAPVAVTVGAARIVQAGRIPHVLGDPSRSQKSERAWRKALVALALHTLETKVEGSTVLRAEELIVA